MTRNLLMVIALVAVTTTALAGCTNQEVGHSHDIRIAFVGKDTALEPHEHPDALANYLEGAVGGNVDVYFFDSSTAALAAVHAGQADFASVDGAAAWLAWQRLGLEAVASEVRSDGRTHYVATAWVQNDSAIMDAPDLADGVTSCHTGATKSAGMFLPMSYLVANFYIDPSSYADDISQVERMARDFFVDPVIGGEYGGYEGALRCLSTGAGDVAFVRDTTPTDYCDEKGALEREWCLPLDQYRQLVAFGPVPEHPIMVRPDMESHVRDEMVIALTTMHHNEQGRAVLEGVFGTSELRTVTTEDHLGGYGSLIAHLPGIEGYAEAK